jgi:Bifunctional DNA primase/polymerase, N-terminal
VNALRETALRYARSGWPVFPCHPGAKEPMTKHGVHDAETDPRVIGRWWGRHPEANIAIATGTPGPTVLDVDIAHGKPGYKSLNAAIRAGLVPPPMASVRTPSGGSHLYYQGDEQGNASMARKGLDLRGRGGYVIAPPSTVGGRSYQVVSHSGAPALINFAAIRQHLEPQADRPAWQPRPGQHPAVHLAGWVAQLTEGNRNDGLFWAACRAAESGDADALDAIARAAKRTGLDQDAISKTIASALRTTHPKAPDKEAG